MAVLYWAKSDLISIGDLENRRLAGEVDTRGASGALSLSGRAPASAAAMALESVGAETPAGAEFQPIGVGKPLSVRIYTIYVGDLPPRNKPNKTRDVLIVSGLKAAQTFDATPRAVNLIQDRVRDKSTLEFNAFLAGSPIVYYTPALTDDETSCSFELVPDTFDGGLVDRIASLFGLAAGLPIFVPASSYLLAGSTMTKMFGAFGSKFLERQPTLTDTLTLRFDVAGFPAFSAGVYAIVNNGDRNELANFSPTLVGPTRMALTRNGQAYDGPAPYMLVGVDGRQEPQLESFAPHVASAALLEKFYPKDENGGTVLIDQLEVAVTLLNDFRYRERAQRLEKRLANMSAGDPQFAEFTELLGAYRANIQNQEFKTADPA